MVLPLAATAAAAATSSLPIVIDAQNQVIEYVRRQIEYYFSEENLLTDIFLRRKMDANGFIALSVIASFNRVIALSQDPTLIVEAVRSSALLELATLAVASLKPHHDIDVILVRTKCEPLKWPLNAPQAPLAPNLNPNVAEFVPKSSSTTSFHVSTASPPAAPEQQQEQTSTQAAPDADVPTSGDNQLTPPPTPTQTTASGKPSTAACAINKKPSEQHSSSNNNEKKPVDRVLSTSAPTEPNDFMQWFHVQSKREKVLLRKQQRKQQQQQQQSSNNEATGTSAKSAQTSSATAVEDKREELDFMFDAEIGAGAATGVATAAKAIPKLVDYSDDDSDDESDNGSSDDDDYEDEDDSDDDDEMDDKLLQKLVIITQTPPASRKPVQHDRTGDHVPRSKMTADLAKVIDDGLFYYEQDLKSMDPTATKRSIELVSSDKFRSLKGETHQQQQQQQQQSSKQLQPASTAKSTPTPAHTPAPSEPPKQSVEKITTTGLFSFVLILQLRKIISSYFLRLK